MPLMVWHFLDKLDPIIRNPHTELIVKAHASLLDRCSYPWHTTHLLGNGQGRAIYLMSKLIGQCQIGISIVILITIKV